MYNVHVNLYLKKNERERGLTSSSTSNNQKPNILFFSFPHIFFKDDDDYVADVVTINRIVISYK